ncbi:MAG TPA: mu-protocadherin-cell-suface protein [Chthoniobacterales bacterium]
MDNRNEAWNNRSEQREQHREDFQKNRDERWDKLESARENRQEWRDQRRGDWQQHRDDLWNYRADRAEEIWDNIEDRFDDIFDDAWWGYVGWGGYWSGYYPSDPWWWWGTPTWSSVVSYTSVPEEPIYTDYGMNVIYEDDTVYVDGKPVPADKYDGSLLEAAATVEQPAPPRPPTDPKQQGDWMPLGVFALAQEKSGDPVMFFQLSVNREGLISGAFRSTLTNDSKPVAGKVDKTNQRAAWRIGDNGKTIYETTLANLTEEVSPIAIHFDSTRTQTWLLVRMPEPAPTGEAQKLPVAPKAPPPLKMAKD